MCNAHSTSTHDQAPQPKARGWLRRLIVTLGLGVYSLTASAADLASISVAPPNPTVAVGALQPFTATGTFSDATTSPLSNATIAAGGNHTCALLASGSVQCWGWNGNGQLGDGSTANSLTPVAVSGISSATAIAAGSGHTCAQLASGGVQCWGSNF